MSGLIRVQLRIEKILQLSVKGYSVTQLAEACGVTERTIYRDLTLIADSEWVPLLLNKQLEEIADLTKKEKVKWRDSLLNKLIKRRVEQDVNLDGIPKIIFEVIKPDPSPSDTDVV